MKPVAVPNAVAKAFDYHKGLRGSMSKDSINLMFLAILFTNVHGQALVLKNFGNKYPTLYLKAILHGYVPEIELEKKEIRNWYRGAVIRQQDGIDPDGFAREAIEEVVHYLGGDEILADISIFNKSQLQKKNV